MPAKLSERLTAILISTPFAAGTSHKGLVLGGRPDVSPAKQHAHGKRGFVDNTRTVCGMALDAT